MECIYYQDLNEQTKFAKIIGAEAKHLKALRLRDNDKIMITNGSGLCAVSTVHRISKEEYRLNVKEYMPNHGEMSRTVGLAIGLLDNRDRFETALEKAVELGVSHFHPVISDYVQGKKYNKSRTELKVIAATKQCKRARLMSVYDLVSIIDFSEMTKDYDQIILADENGQEPNKTVLKKSVLLLIGPEGGFSEEEIKTFKEDSRTELWNLGNRRLRAETAAVICAGIVSASK
jgi:16S rRNA (uracil1498-N3)-methyltransferase